MECVDCVDFCRCMKLSAPLLFMLRNMISINSTIFMKLQCSIQNRQILPCSMIVDDDMLDSGQMSSALHNVLRSTECDTDHIESRTCTSEEIVKALLIDFYAI